MDFRPLNSSVLREVHPLPKVDETLALLTGRANGPNVERTPIKEH